MGIERSLVGNWNYPTSIRFGPGRIRELPEACGELGMLRPLLVTDPGLATLDIVSNALDIARSSGLEVGLFANLKPNPVGRDVQHGVKAYHDGGHDGVIAMGGGSALDVGKAVALMVGQTRPLWDFEDVGDNWRRVDASKMAPVVAVPTTSGTGSEVGRASVVIRESTHSKVIIFHPGMLPGRVVCDPELTVGLPAHLTAAVGMDALSHNLEAFCASGFHPLADGVAVQGILLIQRALHRAVVDGTDVEARSWMMAASLMGATAFQKGLGAMHAISHPIGALFDAHHGLTNAVVMPVVLRHNQSAVADRLARLASYMDLNAPSFDAFLKWVLELRAAVGIPNGLDAVGVSMDDVERLAPLALKDPSGLTNPIPLTRESVLGMIADAVAGVGLSD